VLKVLESDFEFYLKEYTSEQPLDNYIENYLRFIEEKSIYLATEKFATGSVTTVMLKVVESLVPLAAVATSLTVKVPGVINTVLGFGAVDVLEFPKFQ
jgi:hypothetical protein